MALSAQAVSGMVAPKWFADICLEAGRFAMVARLRLLFGGVYEGATDTATQKLSDEGVVDVLWALKCTSDARKAKGERS